MLAAVLLLAGASSALVGPSTMLSPVARRQSANRTLHVVHSLRGGAAVAAAVAPSSADAAARVLGCVARSPSGSAPTILTLPLPRYAMGAGSIGLYLPILANVVMQGSADGLSMSTWAMNAVGFTFSAACVVHAATRAARLALTSTRHRRYNTQKGFPLSAYLDTCTLTVREEDAATAAAPTSASTTPAASGAIADTTHAPLLLLLLLRLPLSLTNPPHSQVQSALILAVTATLQERPKSPVVRTAIGLTYLATAACVCAAPSACTREKTRVSHPTASLSLSLSGFCSARCAQRGCWRRCRSWPRALR